MLKENDPLTTGPNVFELTEVGKIRDAFSRDGFVILKEVYDLQAIEEFEMLVLDTARSWSVARGISATERGDIYRYLSFLESNDRGAFYKLATFIGTSVAGFRLAMSPRIIEAMSIVSETPATNLFCNNPTIFYNDPKVTRLQYLWHQESTYQTDYKHALHIWFPLFRNVQIEDGPMLVKRGAIKRTFPYKYEKRDQGFTQLFVEEDDVAEFETVPCILDRGDAVLFHHSLVHRTGENRSGRARTNMIVRYFDALAEPDFEPVLVYHSRVAHLNSTEAKS
jgi:ectoine hydroxylase-related dioxygenase (phytanoyl-CoA dioxygenase family)